MKLLVVLAFLLSFNLSHSFFSKFIDLSTNSPEYNLVMNPETYSLKEGALLASGVLPENLLPYLTQISNFEEQAKPLVAQKNALDAAYVLFTEMHKKLLKNYDENSTTLDVLLKTGRYNCLSSSVLYGVLLEDFGIPWKAAVLPSHVFLILDNNGAELDVENTTPYGFNISTNREAQLNFKKLTGFDYSADDSIREITGKKGLIAYTYANIAYFAAKLNQDVPSFQNVLKSVAVFDGGRYVYTNVVAGYTQYIYYLIDRAKDYEKALAISREALQNLPRKDMFLSNYYYTLDRYLNYLVEQGRYQDGFQTLADAKKLTGPNRPIEDNLYTRILYRLINKDQDYQKAYDFARTAVTDVAGSQNVKNLLIQGFNQIEKKLVKEWESYPNGEAFFQKWFALMSDDNFRIIYENYYVEVSVKYYEAGNTDKAIEICRKAFTEYPDSRILKRNMVIIAGGAADQYNKAKDYVNGLKYSKIALLYEPKNEVILHNLGIIYDILINQEIDKKNYNQALVMANAALTYVPENKKILYDRDYLLRKLKKK
jgi:tetratricopeptide (TPR) repeat protein